MRQARTESLAKLAAHYDLNERTAAKWGGRTSTQQAPMGLENPVSTGLSPLEAAAARPFRQHMHLPLDDCFYALQQSVRHLSHSALHRLFQRQGISQLFVAATPNKAAKKRARPTPSAASTSILRNGVWPRANSIYLLFVAIDRTSQLAFAELHPAAMAERTATFW